MRHSHLSSVLLASGLLAAASAHGATTTISTAAGAQTVTNGNTLNVTSTGSVTVSSGATVSVTMSGTSTLTNAGTVKQSGTGRAVRNNAAGATLSVTNAATGLIESHAEDAFQVNVDSAVTLDNYGRIIVVNDGSATGQAVDWAAIATKSNTLNNYADALIKTTGEDAVRPGVNGVVTNAGTIQAVPVSNAGAASGSDGIDTRTNTGVQVTNSGSISGRHGITGGNSASAYTITVTNNSGGTLTGVNGSGINIDNPATNSPLSTATVTNYGTIIGRWDNAQFTAGDGDGVDVDGLLTLTNSGIIRGVGGSAGNNPQGLAIGGGSVINNAGAEISGNNPTASGSVGEGIRVDDSNAGNAFGAVSITNSGTIRGYQGAGIYIISNQNNTVFNNAGGTIQGAGTGAAIRAGDGNDTLTNRGTIIADGGKAIDLEGGNDVLNLDGGSIQGDISGGTGTNTLNIGPASGDTLSVSGSISNFDAVNVASGTTTLAGANTFTGATTITGGTLLLANTSGTATGTGAVSVHSGATLGGTGAALGPVAVEAGGILSPATSIGTLTVGNLTLAPSSILAIELDPAQGRLDQVRVTGTVSLNLANLVLTLLSAPTADQTFDILLNDGADAILGRFSQGDRVTAAFGGRNFGFDVLYTANADGGGNDIRLSYTPEPASSLLFVLGGWALRRRLRLTTG